MSRWFLKSQPADVEPISFEDVARLLADGRLGETDQIRSEPNGDWQTADSVIGLLKAAQRLRAAHRPPMRNKIPRPLTIAKLAPLIAATPPVITKLSNLPAPAQVEKIDPPQRAQMAPTAVLSLFVVGICWFAWSWWQDANRFPLPLHLKNPSKPWELPLLGKLSGMESVLLVFDALGITMIGVWCFRTHRR